MVEPPIKRETPALPAPAGRLSWARARRFLLDYSLILALLALMAVAANLSDVFPTPRNQLNILRQVSINGVLAIGMTFVIIVGGIELSLGGVVVISSETPELLRLSDRVVVMYEGRVTATLPRVEATDQSVNRFAHGPEALGTGLAGDQQGGSA